MSKKNKKNKMPTNERDIVKEIQRLAESMQVNIPSEEEIRTEEIDELSFAMAKMHSELDHVLNELLNECMYRYADEGGDFEVLNAGHVMHTLLVSLCIQIFLRASEDEHAIELIEDAVNSRELKKIAKMAKHIEAHSTIETDSERYERKRSNVVANIFDEDEESKPVDATIH